MYNAKPYDKGYVRSIFAMVGAQKQLLLSETRRVITEKAKAKYSMQHVRCPPSTRLVGSPYLIIHDETHSGAEPAKSSITDLHRPQCTQKGVLFHKTGNTSNRGGGRKEA